MTQPILRPSLIIILLGPPGSGKGTQAERLMKEYNLPHISTGNLFRENISLGTPIGLEAKNYIQAGQLVPDEVTLGMVFARISRADCANGYLLDGCPRTIEQAEQLKTIFQQPQTDLRVLCFAIPDEEIIRRISGRLVCRQCGMIYHLDYSPPVQEYVCDHCGGELYRRPDDEPEVIRQRLKVYHAQTQPLNLYYKEQGLLVEIDASLNPDETYHTIQNVLKQPSV